MRHLGKVVPFLILISFSGCNQDSGNSAVDSNGDCTQATIDSYNRLVGRSVSTFTSRSELQSIKSDCSNFKGLIGGNTCKAKKFSTGETMTISANTVDPVCNAATQTLAWLDSGTTQTGNSSSSNSSACTASEISSYNRVLIDTAALSEASTLAALDMALDSCNSFKKTIGNRSCEASKNGSSTWISASSHSSACSKAQTLQTLKIAEIKTNNVFVSTTKEKIVFTMIRGLTSSIPKDAIVIYQNGRAFLQEAEVGLNDSLPHCLVSVKFSTFSKGVGRLTFNTVFLPGNDNLVALAIKSEQDANEENSINCLPAKGKFAKDLTVGDLKTIFNSFVKIELGK